LGTGNARVVLALARVCVWATASVSVLVRAGGIGIRFGWA
jgi:hypothetical protein